MSEEKRKPNVFLEFIKDLLIAVVIAVLIMQVIKPTIVKEDSMLPNFQENNYLIVSKIAYKIGNPERGDVIIFRSNLEDDSGGSGKKKLLIKRVIGLPGDTISFKDRKVYVNGNESDQSYTLDHETYADIDKVELGKDEYFCMGDNRNVSMDSRDPSVGNVKRDTIVGRVVLRLFPFNEIRYYQKGETK